MGLYRIIAFYWAEPATHATLREYKKYLELVKCLDRELLSDGVVSGSVSVAMCHPSVIGAVTRVDIHLSCLTWPTNTPSGVILSTCKLKLSVWFHRGPIQFVYLQC